jgi:hypothetical protein
MTIHSLVSQPCALCRETYPFEEFRMGSAYSRHCKACRPLVKRQIMAWQEEIFILSCFLYEAHFEPVLTDVEFDHHCKQLVVWWEDLSQEFRDRCGLNLEAGTALGLEFTEEEKAAAKSWFRNTRGRDPECLDDL